MAYGHKTRGIGPTKGVNHSGVIGLRLPHIDRIGKILRPDRMAASRIGVDHLNQCIAPTGLKERGVKLVVEVKNVLQRVGCTGRDMIFVQPCQCLHQRIRHWKLYLLQSRCLKDIAQIIHLAHLLRTVAAYMRALVRLPDDKTAGSQHVNCAPNLVSGPVEPSHQLVLDQTLIGMELSENDLHLKQPCNIVDLVVLRRHQTPDVLCRADVETGRCARVFPTGSTIDRPTGRHNATDHNYNDIIIDCTQNAQTSLQGRESWNMS